MFWILALYLDFEGSKTIHVLQVLILGFAGCWRFLTGVLESWFGYGHWLLVDPCSKFWLSILILKVQRTSMSLKSWFGTLETAEGSWLGFCTLILISIWPMVFRHPFSKFWLSILILQVQRTYMSFKSSFGVLEDAGGSWLGFGILILIWIWSLVFDTPMIQIVALYLGFESAKNIHFL